MSSRSSNNNQKKKPNKRKNRATRDDAALSLLPPSRQTRLQKRLAANDKATQIFEILLANNILHWSDAIVLGNGLCRATRTMWKQSYEESYLMPLWNVLEEMVGPSSDGSCGECGQDLCNHLLPHDFDDLPLVQKCAAMTHMLEFMVSNMQGYRTPYSHFDLDDPSNRFKNIGCDITDWEMGFDLETAFLHDNHRRGTLAVTIAIFSFALIAMEQGGDYYFNDIFLGKDNPMLGGGSCYGHVICQMLSEMLPLRDEDLVKRLRTTYPSLKKLAILGPALIPRVVLMAPFFRWVPPDKKDGHKLDELPTPLEEMNETIIRQSDMAQWLEPHHGIGY